MRQPTDNMSIFKKRRQSLVEKAKGAALILISNPERIRNHDVHHAFRQDTNLYYLTGWEEPESILIFRPGQNPETVLFVRPKDVERETWDGFRYGPQGAQQHFGIDQAHLIDDFDKLAVDLLKTCDRLYYRFDIDADFDQKMLGLLARVRRAHGRSGRGNMPIHDSAELIGELRVIKTEEDVQLMRRACSVTAQAHVDVMRSTRPGVTERQLQGVFLHSIYQQNADREGYNAIVATGGNACTLHYVFNDQTCRDGDLLLIDAGAEVRYYTGDITRTFPVNAKFSSAQRKVYDRVLEIQKELISISKPGLAFKQLQDRTIEYLTDAMNDLKLLHVPRSEAVERQLFKKYYPHGVSHYLGMDVHDAGLYQIHNEPRRLEVGMAYTIEPGLYIPADDSSAPEELRGIGVRIEDNVVITSSGCEVMTSAAPKEVAELEALVGRKA
jgi:Xaa-Pro aminopeptidase